MSLGILCEIYTWPHFGFGMRVLFPWMVLLLGVGWLILESAKKKANVIACCFATLAIGWSVYCTSVWNVTGKVFSLSRELDLETVCFAKVPAGTFCLGSPVNEFGRRPDEDEHDFTLDKNLWFSRTEITQEQFEHVLDRGKNPSGQKGENLPVHNMTLALALEFCQELNRRVLDWRFRVPTQDEWEYACRANMSGPICIGTKGDPSNLYDLERLKWDMKKVAVFNADGFAEVGTKRPNNWGFYDMQGNAMEICTEQEDQWRLTDVPLRGGSWATVYESTRCAAKTSMKSYKTEFAAGLRVVAVPIDATMSNQHVQNPGKASLVAKPQVLRIIDRVLLWAGGGTLLLILIRLYKGGLKNPYGELAGDWHKRMRLLPVLCLVIWMIGTSGSVFNSSLGSFASAILSKQNHIVQRCSLSGSLMLVGIVIAWIYIRTLYRSAGCTHTAKFQFTYIVKVIIVALGFCSVLLLISVYSKSLNQKLMAPFLTHYTPGLGGRMVFMSDWTLQIQKIISDLETSGSYKYVGPILIYLSLIVGVVFEELFFRGIIQGCFKITSGPWTAIIVANTLFTAMILFAMPDQVIPAFFVGLGAGCSKELFASKDRPNGSLLCPIALRLLLYTKGFVWLHLGVPYASI
jgi:formylglycine-generating enzyme required for sulfatase activity/membrane protease YdiL (CAAX protease family)